MALNRKEALTMYYLMSDPHIKLKDIASRINISPSTASYIRDKLYRTGILRDTYIPAVQRLGAELLVLVYAYFNPTVPAEKRKEITQGIIEVYDELFLSIGEGHYGFSFNFARNYTSMARINEKRITEFSKYNLLEHQMPSQVVMPFPLTRIYRFFDAVPLVKKHFGIEEGGDEEYLETLDFFENMEPARLKKTDSEVFQSLIEHPEWNDRIRAEHLGISSRYVSMLRGGFEEKKLLRRVALPDFNLIGMEVKTLNHGIFNPHNPPTHEDIVSIFMKNPYCIFFARSKYEYVSVSVYPDFPKMNMVEGNIISRLKRDEFIYRMPKSLTFTYKNMVRMKELSFAPIVKKLIE